MVPSSAPIGRRTTDEKSSALRLYFLLLEFPARSLADGNTKIGVVGALKCARAT